MLDIIINLGETSFESSEIGTRWLDILSSSDVDFDEYLRKEGLGPPNRARFPEVLGYDDVDRAMEIQIHKEGGNLVLSCDWFIEPEAEAFEAIHEFRHFGPKTKHNYNYEWD